MTMLLASVTGPEEAEIALAHGADVIDLKDASKGALGVVAHEIVRVSVRRVDGRRYVSAVTGDLPMQPECLVDAVMRMAETGVDYVKVGLFPGPNREACVRALSVPARATKLVGVMFADCAPDGALLPLMADAGFAGVMLDTANKGNGRLLDHLDADQIYTFPFSWRGGLDYDTAFVLGSGDDAFMVVGKQAEFEFLRLNQAVTLDSVEEQEISADDIDFDLL